MANAPAQFGIRTLFAVVTGASLICLLLSWSGDGLSATLISCWAIGTSLGAYLSVRFGKSIVFGSLIGGAVGSLIGYFIVQAVAMPRMLAGVSVEEILMLLGFSMCGSAVFATVVGIVQGGITLPHKPARTHTTSDPLRQDVAEED